jgi:hypothetical protein
MGRVGGEEADILDQWERVRRRDGVRWRRWEGSWK